MCKTLALTLSALLGAACAGSATGVEYSGTVTVSSPELITTREPGVFVVADADQPVFFTDNQYYLYRDNGWYRSVRYDRGYVRVDAPPARLRHIDQPYAYVHYRARAQSAHNQRQSPTNYEPREPDQVKPQTEPTPQPQQAPLQPPTAPQPPIPNPRPPQQQPPIDPGSPGTTDQNPQPPQ